MSNQLLLASAKHDPDAVERCGPWSVELTLEPGVSLVDPTTAAPYDDAGQPLPSGDSFSLLSIAYALINASTNTWGISFYTLGGGVRVYRAEIHYFKDDGTDDHEVVRIESVRKRAISRCV